jgi:membrane protease subunit (stomatin/prohibitin family)
MSLVNQIKFDSPSDNILVWKYPSENIKLGSQLIVNQSQEAIFVKGGKALDVFGPGTHTLSTGNLPIISKIINIPFGGKTPFTAEIWFVNKTIKRGLKWGTKGAIQLIDPVYNYPVSVRAFGGWGLRVDDCQSFVNQIIGTMSLSVSEKIEEFFISEIIQKLSDTIANVLVQDKVSVFQISSKISDISINTQDKIISEFGRFGIEIVNFNVERISIPQEEQKKFQEILGKKMEIEEISKANVGQAYTTMRSFDTLDKAAQNEGGGAGQILGAGLGIGMGLGAGVPIGNQVGKNINVGSDSNEGPKEESTDPMVKIKKLKMMLDEGLITQEDYDNKKNEILSKL